MTQAYITTKHIRKQIGIPSRLHTCGLFSLIDLSLSLLCESIRLLATPSGGEREQHTTNTSNATPPSMPVGGRQSHAPPCTGRRPSVRLAGRQSEVRKSHACKIPARERDFANLHALRRSEASENSRALRRTTSVSTVVQFYGRKLENLTHRVMAP